MNGTSILCNYDNTTTGCFSSSNETIIQFGFPAYSPIPFWICLSIETLITIVGNAMLICLFFKHEELRAGHNYFIISLSASDMLGGFALIPCEYCSVKGSSVPECPFICGSIISFIMATTVINLILIACDRYIAIRKPFLYVGKFTKRRALFFIIFGWSISIFICLLPIFWQFNHSIDLETKFYINIAYAATLFFSTILAGMFMAVAYIFILKTIRLKVNQMGMKSANPVGITVCIISTSLYFVSWIQYCVVELLLQYGKIRSKAVIDASYFIFMLSPCLDSVLYAYYRRDFRRCLMSRWKEQWVSLKSIYSTLDGRVEMNIQYKQEDEELMFNTLARLSQTSTVE